MYFKLQMMSLAAYKLTVDHLCGNQTSSCSVIRSYFRKGHTLFLHHQQVHLHISVNFSVNNSSGDTDSHRAAVAPQLDLDPVEPSESFSSDMRIFCLISSQTKLQNDGSHQSASFICLLNLGFGAEELGVSAGK